MASFADLSACSYHPGALDADYWTCPLLAVGWLEQGDDLQKGVCPTPFSQRVKFLRDAMESQFPDIVFRGFHYCSLCRSSDFLSGSNINLIIPGEACVYAAPGRIDHYVEKHGYCPPRDFIDAVFSCLDPRSEEYLLALKDSNGGVDLPLIKGSILG